MKTKNISFAAFAFLPALSLSAKEECGQSPNVVMFLIDDLGWNDFGCYGSRFYQTPTIDSLAHAGFFSQTDMLPVRSVHLPGLH